MSKRDRRRTRQELADAILIAASKGPVTEKEMQDAIRGNGNCPPDIAQTLCALILRGSIATAGIRHTLDRGLETLFVAKQG